MSLPEHRAVLDRGGRGVALPEAAQTILFDDILFWNEKPAGHPAWAGIDLALLR